MRAGVYTRLSHPGDNTELQQNDCMELLLVRGWTHAGTWSDNGRSGYDRKAKRPAYRQMLAAVDAGKLDAIVVYNLDRLTRQPRELEAHVDGYEQHHVIVVACTGESLTDAADFNKARFAVIQANQASVDMSRRLKRRLLANAQAGRPHGSRAYGYTLGPSDAEPTRKVELVPEEAAFVRMAAAAVLAGTSLRQTALRLNAAGALTPAGNPWKPFELRRLLLRARYAGKRSHQGETYDAPWVGIVTTDEQVQLRGMLRSKENAGVGRPPAHMLSGLLKCGKCGHGLIAKKVNTGAARYVCPTKPIGCGGLSIGMHTADAEVERSVLFMFGEGFQSTAGGAPDRGELGRLQKARLELVDALTSGHMTIDQVARGTKTYDAQIAAEEARLLTQAGTQAAVAQASNLDARWSTMDVNEKRAVIAVVIDRLTLAPAAKGLPMQDRIGIDWTNLNPSYPLGEAIRDLTV